MKSAEQIAEEIAEISCGQYYIHGKTLTTTNKKMLAGYVAQAITAERERAKVLLEACEFYGDEKSYYLQEDKDTGSQVRRCVEYFDTESYGYQKDPHSPNILQVFAGKRARAALAKYKGEMG